VLKLKCILNYLHNYFLFKKLVAINLGVNMVLIGRLVSLAYLILKEILSKIRQFYIDLICCH